MSYKIICSILLVFAILLTGFGGIGANAMSTIVVDNTADDIIKNGNCTLREAIIAADTDTAIDGCPAGGGSDIIVLANGATYTLTEGTLPAIHSQITIEGDESIVERSSIAGTPDFRIFYLAANGDLTLNALTVRNGSTVPGEGGGIKNWGNLTLKNSTVSDNSGNGIITLAESTLNISDSNISGNIGVGISNNRGFVVIENSNVSDNYENARGGGISNYLGSVEVFNSTISGNSVTEHGGGIYNRGFLTLTNSTVSGNTATGNGGGIWNYGGNVILTHSTISANDASAGSGIYHQGIGKVVLAKTIMGLQLTGQNCAGYSVISGGYNLASDGTCNLTSIGDISGVNPYLNHLGDNGGPTETHALLAASPAINAVPVTDCVLATDQRGVSRPQGSACDIGSFEVSEISVDIDIKPSGDPTSINLESHGVVPVAILTTDDFDSRSIDPVSVLFADAYPLRWAVEDVDFDGDMDYLFFFKTQELNLDENSTDATLTGTTFAGVPIIGKGAINVVP